MFLRSIVEYPEPLDRLAGGHRLALLVGQSIALELNRMALMEAGSCKAQGLCAKIQGGTCCSIVAAQALSSFHPFPPPSGKQFRSSYGVPAGKWGEDRLMIRKYLRGTGILHGDSIEFQYLLVR